MNSPFQSTLIFLMPFFFFLGNLTFPSSTWPNQKLFNLDVPSYAILLTSDLEEKKPMHIFSCSRPIYIYFTWYRLDGQHTIDAFWINPQGKKENQIQLKFVAKTPEFNNWVALEFKNILDQFNLLTPNLKASKLSGKWKVRILLDGKLLENLDFIVHCE